MIEMSVWWDSIYSYIEPYWHIFRLLIIIIIAFIVLNLILRVIKRNLLKLTKNKKQAASVTIFIDMLKYLFALIFIIIVVFSYYNSWGELGFIAGLMTVAIGWALQKPISGVVAWLIIIARRPFNVGDRIIISGITGDIKDISLTHLMLDEVGGTIDGEESSNRTVMIPTSMIFEEEVINFTEIDEYILDEIKCSVTYESKLEEAESIVISCAEKIMKEYWKKFPKKISTRPHTRINFLSSGIELTVRYNTITTLRNGISTDIRREIHKAISNSENVNFAYPHTEVLFKDKQNILL